MERKSSNYQEKNYLNSKEIKFLKTINFKKSISITLAGFPQISASGSSSESLSNKGDSLKTKN